MMKPGTNGTFTPDAVILDINLDGETDGIHLAEYINKHYHLPFLFLTSYADRDTIERKKSRALGLYRQTF